MLMVRIIFRIFMSAFTLKFWFFFLKGVFSYIADITTEEERTLRIGIVNLCFSLGVPIGMAFSGILLK
jgi:PCFT/HCP family folate transporter-like MFS transporter 1/3